MGGSTYRIVENFQGRKLSRICEFSQIGCIYRTKGRHVPKFRRATETVKCAKFSPSKVSRYRVYFIFLGTLHFLSEAKLEKQQQLCSCKSHFPWRKRLPRCYKSHPPCRTCLSQYHAPSAVLEWHVRSCYKQLHFAISMLSALLLREQEQSYWHWSTAVCLILKWSHWLERKFRVGRNDLPVHFQLLLKWNPQWCCTVVSRFDGCGDRETWSAHKHEETRENLKEVKEDGGSP